MDNLGKPASEKQNNSGF